MTIELITIILFKGLSWNFGTTTYMASLYLDRDDLAFDVVNRIGQQPPAPAFFIEHTTTGLKEFRLIEKQSGRGTQGQFVGKYGSRE